MAGLNIKKEPGIGPMGQPSSRPLNEPTPLSGPPHWTAGDNNRAGAFAQNGEYVDQDPSPGPTGPDPAGHMAPTSDVSGSMDMAALHMAGRYGPKPPPGEPPAVGNC